MGGAAIPDLGRLWPSLLILGALLAVSVWLLVRHPRCGFPAAWFFLILAPTSSVIPINDLVFEHRMYLPLAAVVTVVVFAVFELWNRWCWAAVEPAVASRRWIGAVAIVAATLGTLTFLRNRVFADALTLWSDVVTKCPENGRAQANLAQLLAWRGQPRQAVEHFQEARRLMPFAADDAKLQRDWGSCLMQLEQGELAVPYLLRSIGADANDADTHLNLAALLAPLGYRTASHLELEAAMRLNPVLRGEFSNATDATHHDLDMRRRSLAQHVAGQLGAGLNYVLEHPADPCRGEYEIGMALLKAGEYPAALTRFAATHAACSRTRKWNSNWIWLAKSPRRCWPPTSRRCIHRLAVPRSVRSHPPARGLFSTCRSAGR